MRSFLLCFVVLAGCLSGLWGCKNCGPSAEPLLYLSVWSDTPARLDTLYAPDSRGPMPAQPYSTTAPTTGRQLTLPVNLNADSTRYVFRLSGRQDTVTVFYRRDFYYRDRGCGYVVNLYQPGKKPDARTSRGQVLSVSYQQNTDGYFLTSSRNTGISLNVRL